MSSLCCSQYDGKYDLDIVDSTNMLPCVNGDIQIEFGPDLFRLFGTILAGSNHGSRLEKIFVS